MHIDLLNWICCPSCKSDLALTVVAVSGTSTVTDGTLTCSACKTTYPIIRGVPRFASTDGYAGSFSYEWNRWSRVQLDSANGRRESEATFTEKTGFTASELAGKLVLDVGCGAGRFLDVAERWGARVIGVDFSFAVEAAQANVGDRLNADVIQADVFNLPFRDDIFDAVFSLGVLHHTRDTRAAFLALPRHVRPGGAVAVWLYYYTDRLYNRATDAWRRLFRGAPNWLLYGWSWLLCALFSGLYRRRFMNRLPWYHLQRVLPVNKHPDWQWRVLDTFDWYSPTFQDKECSPERVIGWCREGGLRAVEVFAYPTSIRARRESNLEVPLVATLPDLRRKRLVVFGAGALGAQAIDCLQGIGVADRIVAVCDNDTSKAGMRIAGHTVRAFADLARDSYDHVIIASQLGLPAIAAQLSALGLVGDRDFFPFRFIEEEAPLLRLACQGS
jgi:SAM-dependent methyltransferase/uncharacterized protein YbaR (Trm112 family)